MKTDKSKQKTGLARLLEIAAGKRWLVAIAIFLAICFTLLQFVPFFSVYKIITLLVAHIDNPATIDMTLVYYWAYVTLVSFIIYSIILYVSVMCSHIAAFNILYEIRVQLARKLVCLPLSFFSHKATGDIKKIMTDDVERIELFVAHHLPDLVSALVVPLLLISYMFYIEWRLALIILVIFILAMRMTTRMMVSDQAKQIFNDYTTRLAKMNGSMIEYIRGIQVVKTFTNSTKAYKQLNHDINEYGKYSREISFLYLKSYTRFLILLLSTILFVAPVAIWLLLRAPSYTDYLPNVLLFLIFSISIFSPIIKLMWIAGMMNQNLAGVAVIDNILYAPEIEQANKVTTQAQVLFDSANIKFEDVMFSYDGKRDVLTDVNFEASSGTITALVGPSGAGKSTIAMLIARFADVTQGQITISNLPITEIPIEQLMHNISFVFQDNVLFFDTIEENIRMGNSEASFEEVVEAAKKAQCHEFIQRLADGYNTLVGEGGTYLSGGEAQRIALARVALKNAPILLLDEATAFADPGNEVKILTAFSELTKNKTVIVIAHRLGTIVNADQILYIDQGSILEHGTHQDLLAQKGSYAKMWDTYSASQQWTLAKA